jgi:hypothetical protein
VPQDKHSARDDRPHGAGEAGRKGDPFAPRGAPARGAWASGRPGESAWGGTGPTTIRLDTIAAFDIEAMLDAVALRPNDLPEHAAALF